MLNPKKNKNFMTLTNDECLEVGEKISVHAQYLITDAKFLSEKSSYGTATLILITAMEEYVKALILLMDGHGFQFRGRVKGIKTLFINHRGRYPVLAMILILSIFLTDIFTLIKRLRKYPEIVMKFRLSSKKWEGILGNYFVKLMDNIKEELEWFSNIDRLRQNSIYINYDNGIVTPNDISKSEYLMTLSRAEKMMLYIELVDETYKDGGSELSAEIKESKGQLITEGIYINMGKALSKLNGTRDNSFSSILDLIEEVKEDLTKGFDVSSPIKGNQNL